MKNVFSDGEYYAQWDPEVNRPRWYHCRACNGMGSDPYGLPCEACSGSGYTLRIVAWLSKQPIRAKWQFDLFRNHFPVRRCKDCGRFYWDAQRYHLCPDDNCPGSLPF